MTSDNTSILKADLTVGFPYRFDSSSLCFCFEGVNWEGVKPDREFDIERGDERTGIL